MSLQGSKLWSSTLFSYVQTSDWDLNNGGVILWKDGTIWSFESESPAGTGEIDGWPFFGFCISELRTGNEVWENLTPDLWGFPQNDHPPSYPNWPYFGNRTTWLRDADMSGPLNVALFGYSGTDWQHIMDPDDDDLVWFYTRFGGDATASNTGLGPISVRKSTRTWHRHLTDYTTLGADGSTPASLLWDNIASNLQVKDGYFVFLANPIYVGGGDPYNSLGMRLVYSRISDPNDTFVKHQWDDPLTWDEGFNTNNVSVPDVFDNQYMVRSNYSIAIDGDRMYYTFGDGSFDYAIKDSRTTSTNGSWNNNDPSERNHNMLYSKIGYIDLTDHTNHLLLYNNMPQEWVGYGGANYGTLTDDTVGIYNRDDFSATRSNDFEALGPGLRPQTEMPAAIRDGWLYYFDWGGRNFGVYGTAYMLCRIDLSKLDPAEPQALNRENPQYEIIANGNVPFEGNAGHWGRSGTWIWQRNGANPLMPFPDSGLTFAEDGSIWYKGMAFPLYYRVAGYGIRGIWILQPARSAAANATVTVSFQGDELKGYSSVREVPARARPIEVELT
jgi:hypothetical protein